MSTRFDAPPRPARTYVTGPVTRVLRMLSVLVMLGITVWILASYPSLPETVATHFDVRGEADEWGPRWSLLVLTGVMVVLSLLLLALSTRPRALNLPIEVTASNAQAVYRDGERLMVWTVLAMQLFYLGIGSSVILGGGGTLVAIGLVGMIGGVVVGIIRLVRAAR